MKRYVLCIFGGRKRNTHQFRVSLSGLSPAWTRVRWEKGDKYLSHQECISKSLILFSLFEGNCINTDLFVCWFFFIMCCQVECFFIIAKHCFLFKTNIMIFASQIEKLHVLEMRGTQNIGSMKIKIKIIAKLRIFLIKSQWKLSNSNTFFYSVFLLFR